MISPPVENTFLYLYLCPHRLIQCPSLLKSSNAFPYGGIEYNRCEEAPCVKWTDVFSSVFFLEKISEINMACIERFDTSHFYSSSSSSSSRSLFFLPCFFSFLSLFLPFPLFFSFSVLHGKHLKLHIFFLFF